MKMKKLKYVFAFVLMAVVTLTATNVSAAVNPKNTPISIRSIIQTIANIDDGDPVDETNPREIRIFDFLGKSFGEMNPVKAYTYVNNTNGFMAKAYMLQQKNLVSERGQVVPATDGSVGYSALDARIGLGLTFGLGAMANSQSLGALSNTQLQNQSALDTTTMEMSMATQVYVWMANQNFANEAGALAMLNANEQKYYNQIKNYVNLAQSIPSFAYGTEAESKSHPIEMSWNEETSRYEYIISDDNHIISDNLTPLISSDSVIKYYKSGANDIVFYATEQAGTADAPITIAISKAVSGARLPQYVTAETGDTLVYLSNVSQLNTTSYISLYTNALRVRVKKALGPSRENPWTGDAKVEGAVYGVYSDSGCQNLVQEIVTDANGVATSRPLEFKDYYVKEIKSSEGTKIDPATKTARANDAITEGGQRVVEVSSTDDVIYGGMTLVVSNSDLTDNTTKEPAVLSKIVVTLDSDPTQTYEGTTDDTGYVSFENIPYGHYTVKEMEKQNEEVDYMDPIKVYIDSEKTYNYNGLVNTEVSQRKLKIVKVDAESGLVIPIEGTSFIVYDEAGTPVTQTATYPEPTTLSLFETTDEGHVVLPEKLPYGKYTIVEKNAPVGYYNEVADRDSGVTVSGEFEVVNNDPEHPEDKPDIEVKIADMPQKVLFRITTKGTALTSTTSTNDEGYTINRPTYSEVTIPGVQYKITALEDITTGDNVIHMRAGESRIFNSNEDLELYLGSYSVEKVGVPQGYVLKGGVKTLTLEPRTQENKEWREDWSEYIEKQNYTVDFQKEFDELKFFKADKDGNVVSVAHYTDVVVGIYAAEDITNVLGNVIIPKDTLVEAVRMDSEGKAVLDNILPMGKFYAKELETDENYELSDEKYEIDAIPTNYTDLTFDIPVDKIQNHPKNVTKFILTKIENVNETIIGKIINWISGKTLSVEGAKFGIYYTEDGEDLPLLEKVDGEYVGVVRTTDKNGQIVIEGMPFGQYKVKELEAPKYYEVNNASFDFELTDTEKGRTAEITVQDTRIMINYTVTITDEDGEVVEGAVVDLVDPETNEVVYSAETDEEGVADFGEIRAGKYIRKVSTLPPQYVVPEDLVLDTEEDVDEEIIVRYVVGNILVYKTDAETTKPVAGCTFQVLDYESGEVLLEGVSGEDGNCLFENLRYGKYLVKEVSVPENYELNEDVYEVDIVEDGVTVVVDFANVPTGDIAVASYVLMAIISLGAIVIASKKLVRN